MIKGYRNVVLIVGGDRIADMKREISKYIKHEDKKEELSLFEFDNFSVDLSSGKKRSRCRGDNWNVWNQDESSSSRTMILIYFHKAYQSNN